MARYLKKNSEELLQYKNNSMDTIPMWRISGFSTFEGTVKGRRG
jgi:abortive infection bacteriophage resistance protein